MINTLVIESPKILYMFIEDLISEINGIKKGFVLSENNNILNMSNEIDIVLDIIGKDLNSKSIINKLYTRLNNVAIENELFMKSCEVKSQILNYIEEILLNFEYPVEYNTDIDIKGIFKLLQIKFQTEKLTILEKILDYMSLMQEFCGISVFVFLNLKCILDYKELEEMYEFVNYKKINIILIENTIREKKYINEKILIIDNDFCEIFYESI